jgi:glutamyl-tRNA synthetase
MAAKAAHKAGGQPPAAAGGKPPAAAAAAGGGNNNKGAPINFMAAKSLSVPPMQLVINPNSKFSDRPLVALTMAILTNTDVDLTLVSDHRIPQAATLGMEDGQVLVGDLAMARYLVGRSSESSNSIISPLHNAWMDYAQSLIQLPEEQRFKGIGMTLEHACQSRTYLVGHSLSIADVALFSTLGFPSQAADFAKILKFFEGNSYPVAARWVSMVAMFPAIEKATQLAVGASGTEEATFYNSPDLDPLVSGMNLLEGATPGRVVTRFPPEPSGYLHVGHAKAVLLNDYYARRYKGRLIVRFDDTNPSKEKEEYQQAIVEDLALLGVKHDVVTYTSDYFPTITGYALTMIEQGLAYMDDTPQEEMKLERADRIESKHRSMSPAESKEKFELLCSGSPDGATWCLRAKIDMSSDNGTLRDPVLFRQNLTPHHRSGTQYKAYPTYDLACPIVDSLEGVTHALRTTEYNDRDEQYQWILKALNLRRVRIHAFSRVNFMYTLLSKRKLAWFVEQGLVNGWGDARMPTVRGVVRRGVNIRALKTFIYSQGASRRVVNMEWGKFWAENKKEIDKTAKRFMAIDTKEHVSLTVTNAPSIEDNAYLGTAYHPKDPTLGNRVIRIGKDILLEKGDTEGIVVGEGIVLLRWGKYQEK